jgi:hypothetical protein
MIASTINGLPISTNSENRIAPVTCVPKSDRSSVAPSAMKKNSSRKSRKGASRAAMVSR